MENEFLKLSVSEFAKLHGVNKRTLHIMTKFGYLHQNIKAAIIIDIMIINRVLILKIYECYENLI